jgi:histidinol-phosphate/aromatic aminotransferase/cobyric acid decarboxylase-like protein
MEKAKVEGADPTPIIGVCEVVFTNSAAIVVDESYGDFTRKLEDALNESSG